MNLSPRTNLCAGLLTIFLIHLGLSSACRTFASQADVVFLTLASPGGRYTVAFKGEPERPWIGTNIVTIDVGKEGRTYAINEFLHSGDAMDASFSVAYPNREWVTESMLRLYRESTSEEEPRVLVSLENQSDAPIKILKVFTSDKYLLFDVPSRGTRTLEASPPKGDFMDFYVDGEYEDGRRFEFGTGRPILSAARKGSYSIVIRGSTVEIQ